MTYQISLDDPYLLPEIGMGSATVNHLLEIQAARFDRCPAVSGAGGPPLSYAGLCAHVLSIGAQLSALGVDRADRVAVVLPNGPCMATAFLGAATAAVCAPLNPAYRASEFDFYLADLDAKALIVQEHDETPAAEAARERGIPVLRLLHAPEAGTGSFSLFSDAGSSPIDLRPKPASPDDIALVLHTSGTTARPKIVPLTHANLLASARAVAGVLALTPGDRCLNVMPLFHIHGLVSALLASLSAGASVFCTSGFSAPDFFSALGQARASWYTAVPTMHQSILARADLECLTPEALRGRSDLRLIRSSSAALPPPVMAALETLFDVPVLEAYGMTEAAHQMACNPLPPRARKAGSVGVAAGPEVAVMDSAGGIVPAGTTGEVVIRGANVTPGYEANPEANASAFCGGWFRTGDQGHLDGDGYLFLTGRLKELINRGGEKIAPREIDEVLLAHPAVAQAVAFAAPHERLGEAVMAAVVLRPEYALSEHALSDRRRQERELREFAAARLADFKVPSCIVFLDEIPKGATGKVQRIGLAEQLKDALHPADGGEAAGEAARGDAQLEAAVTELIEDVLGRSGIGRDDNFFQAGGDSLLAATLLARLEKSLDLTLSLIRLFEVPTVSGMAVAAADARAEAASAQTREEKEIARMLAEIDALSDDEAEHLLKAAAKERL